MSPRARPRSVLRVTLRDGLPRQVALDDGRPREVLAVLDAWRVGNRWWRREPPSHHYLLELDGGLTADVFVQAGTWRLEGILD